MKIIKLALISALAFIGATSASYAADEAKHHGKKHHESKHQEKNKKAEEKAGATKDAPTPKAAQ